MARIFLAALALACVFSSPAFAAVDDPVTRGDLGAMIGFGGLGLGALILIGVIIAVIGGIIISAWSH